jgi:hypothetical protein
MMSRRTWRDVLIQEGVLRPRPDVPEDAPLPDGVRVLALDDAGRASAARSMAKFCDDERALSAFRNN